MNNMLSAKKVRIHGMTSSRWTTKDKITQYKGLINLYKRDSTILAVDTAVAQNKQIKELKQLRKDIKTNRESLDNAVGGDRQRLRNNLLEHKDLLNTFQNSHPLKVIDHLHQGNFNERKLIDRMDYRIKQKTQILIKLKLELAELEDRLKYEDGGQLPIEKEAQIITGKVQDVNLKKEAAISVQHTFKNVLYISKKDSLYFDAVLGALKVDSYHQSRCMVRTTELGQLATEYLDDRKQEFKQLEMAVKRDMRAREESLRLIREESKELTDNMGLLIRKGTDVNIGKVVIPKTKIDFGLQNHIESIENILNTLKDTAIVANFSCILPCIMEQQRQTERLSELLALAIENHAPVAHKRDEASILYKKLLHTMNDKVYEYKSEKAELLDELVRLRILYKEHKETSRRMTRALAQGRSSIQQLCRQCGIVLGVEQKERSVKPPSKGISIVKGERTEPIATSAIDEDGMLMISILEPKLNALMNSMVEQMEGEKLDAAKKTFQVLTEQTCASVIQDSYGADDSLITDIMLEDPTVLTYTDIKLQSQKLVELHTVNEDLIPKKRKKKKAKF